MSAIDAVDGSPPLTRNEIRSHGPEFGGSSHFILELDKQRRAFAFMPAFLALIAVTGGVYIALEWKKGPKRGGKLR